MSTASNSDCLSVHSCPADAPNLAAASKAGPVAAEPLLAGMPVELPRVLSVATARRLGLSRSAVRNALARRGWQQLVPGMVLTAAGEPTRADWALVGVELAGEYAALSGWDALRLRGLGARRPPSPEVLVLDRCGRHRVAGRVRIRPTRRPFVSSMTSSLEPDLPFVPVVCAARAIADTALQYRTLPPVRALATSAIQRGLCAPAELAAELDAGPRNGSALLRLALDDVLDGAHSIAEAEAVDFLRQADVPAFELNVAIVDHTGRVLAVADVLWRALRAIAEVDSKEFHFDEPEWQATSRRHNRLTGRGFAVQHYPPSEIRDRGTYWADEVAQWLRARAVELGVPYLAGGVAYGAGGVPLRPGPDGPPPYVLPPPPPLR